MTRCWLLVVVVLALCSTAQATIFEPSAATGNLTTLGQLHYPGSNSSPPCDFLHQPCAPLNDCWGTERNGKQYAFVGLSNGVDFLDTTDPDRPKKTAPNAFIPGCITEWRDIKSYRDAVYVVNDATSLCRCEQQPCQFQLQFTGLSVPVMDAQLGQIGAPLTPEQPVFSGVVAVSSLSADGCRNDSWLQAPVDGDWIALVQRGNCPFAAKLQHAESAGAQGVIVINYRDDDIPPSMMGEPGVHSVPIALVSFSNGQTLLQRVTAGASVYASFVNTSWVNNPELQPPEGLWVVNFSAPEQPRLLAKRRDWFNFCHNILVDTLPNRPYLYACGTDTNNGGLLMFSIDNPFDPVLLGAWNLSYFHDVEVAYRQDLHKHVLFGSAIYDDKIYMLDVDDPHSPSFLSIVAVWDTPAWPHNTAATPDGRLLYVTHEDFAMAITIWNVEHLDRVEYVGNISIQADRKTIPHNIYLRGDHLWASYYVNGVAVFSIHDPHRPTLLAVSSDMVDPRYPPGSGYHGVWGIYPLPKDDTVISYASDIETGFYSLKLYLPAAPTDEGGISGFGIFVVIVVILLVLGGCFFVYRYMQRNKIDLGSFHSSLMPSAGDSRSEDKERLALDDEEDEEEEYYRNEI